jgi:hypothetical protein
MEPEEMKTINDKSHYEVHEGNRVEVYHEVVDSYATAGNFIRGGLSTDEIALLISDAFARGYNYGKHDSSEIIKAELLKQSELLSAKVSPGLKWEVRREIVQ